MVCMRYAAFIRCVRQPVFQPAHRSARQRTSRSACEPTSRSAPPTCTLSSTADLPTDQHLDQPAFESFSTAEDSVQAKRIRSTYNRSPFPIKQLGGDWCSAKIIPQETAAARIASKEIVSAQDMISEETASADTASAMMIISAEIASVKTNAATETSPPYELCESSGPSQTWDKISNQISYS